MGKERQRLGIQRVSVVSIRVGLEGDRIHDSLIEYELITFVFGEGEELIVFGIAHGLMRLHDLGLPWT